MIPKKILLIPIACLFSVLLTAQPMHREIEVTFIGNTGFLVSGNGKKILVDALFCQGFNMYSVPADSNIQKILHGREPFDNANLLLITHCHPDHFDANLVCKYLSNNPRNIVVAPELVIKSIKNTKGFSIPEKQLLEIHKFEKQEFDTTVAGVKIHSMFLQHDNRPQIENVGYLIETGDNNIFHCGDNNGSNEEEFRTMKLQDRKIDLALLNVYGFWGSKDEREFTKKYIHPKHIVLMHVPANETGSVRDSCNKISDFYDITVFSKSLEKKVFTVN